jgi:hypothetical protein
VDERRVADIRCGVADLSHTFGSGYLVAPRLVLTARHVVIRAATAGGVWPRVEVRIGHPRSGARARRAAEVAWCHPERDAALLLLDEPVHVPGTVRWARAAGRQPLRYEGVGYPRAALANGRREPEYLRGFLPVMSGGSGPGRYYVLDQEVFPQPNRAATRAADEKEKGWAGASGSAVFCLGRLVGVAVHDDDAFGNRRLHACPVETFATDPGFVEVMRSHAEVPVVGVVSADPDPDPEGGAGDTATRLMAPYLRYARRAAAEHPYAGVLPGTTPPLTDVYLRQRLRRRERDSFDELSPTAGAMPPVSADVVLADPRTCVVIAGPGGGKSSLLRNRLARGLDDWQDGRTDALLPVLVSAAALTEHTLAEALARAVTTDLELVEPLEADFFAAPPAPGAAWLVLVDGLDEVADHAAQQRVLRLIGRVRESEQRDLYRFVVATRPLPGSELDTLGVDVPRYDLQPFGAADLVTVATAWFAAMRLEQPGDAATRFIEALARSRLVGPARVPLMTAMLCQLHAADPDSPLPTNRGRIYRDFVTLLHKAEPAATRPAARYPGLERYGPTVHARAEAVLAGLSGVIDHLAVQRHRGVGLPTREVVRGAPGGIAATPDDVRPDDWDVFLNAVLRRTGLLVAQVGDLSFIHRTMQEYLAARHSIREDGERAVARAFHQPRRYLPSTPVEAGVTRVWSRRYWAPPTADPSYVGFLIDLALDRDADGSVTTDVLSRLATRGGLPGCRYIAALARLGTRLSGEVLAAAAESLDAMGRSSVVEVFERLRAAETLAELGDERSSGHLYAVASEYSSTSLVRMRAAEILAERGDIRGNDILCGLAGVAAGGPERAEVASGSERGEVPCFPSPRYAKVSGHPRSPAGALLEERVQPEYHPVLIHLEDGQWGVHYAEADRPAAVAVLRAIAAESHLRAFELRAAECLTGLGDPRGREALRRLATAAGVDGCSRIRAAAVLAALGDAESPAPGSGTEPFLRLLMSDLCEGLRREPVVVASALPGKSGSRRGGSADQAAEAAAFLTNAQLGDPQAAERVHGIVLDEGVDVFVRLQAAEILAGLGDTRATDALHVVATVGRYDGSDNMAIHRPWVPDYAGIVHLRAAELLAGYGDRRAADCLHALAVHPEFDTDVQQRAAEGLAGLGDARSAQFVSRNQARIIRRVLRRAVNRAIGRR